jgi:hypothetical protein
LILVAFTEIENQLKKFFFLTDARRSIMKSANLVISILEEWLQIVSKAKQQASAQKFVALKERLQKRISSRFGVSTSDLIPQAPQKLTETNHQVIFFKLQAASCNHS